METAQLACSCGNVRLAVTGRPIITAECHCNSCREAGAHFARMDGAPDFRSPNGGTPFVMMRKDRVAIVAGGHYLKAFHLGESTTRRVVATCCNTPVFLEFKGGHWLSLYSSIWPGGAIPAIKLRTMTSDLADPAILDHAVPAGGRHTLGFYARLLGAWIAMGFRTPRVEVAEQGVLH